MSADGPGNREVAHRIFAAEFDDATLSYSESDEERAPNYVVTPTGARVNRLFAVGVLTEVESVNEDTVRGRIVDPTGAFVTYAGQYQPDEHAFLGRTTPPAFVALTGKARTFEPDDSDAVYTSVRPESFNDVDAATRDRWSVSAAENTLHRLAVFAAALDSGLRGDRLQAALETAGVSAPLSTGIPRAIDHYGTTKAYLEAVRTLSIQTLEQVAGDREDVESLSVAPDDAGPAELGPLPSVDLDLSVPEGFESESAASADASASGAEAETETETATPDGADGDDHVATGEPAASNEVDAEAGADADTPEPAAPEAEVETGGDADTPDPAAAEAEAGETETPDGADADDHVATGEPAASNEVDAEAGGDADTPDPAAPEAEAGETASADDDLGDFDADGPGSDLGDEPADDLGDFDAGEAQGASSDADEESVDGDEPEDAEGFDEEDALTEEERAEVEAEYGTDFSTGSEVGGPGEADIDVPTSEEDLEALEDDVADEDVDDVDVEDTADTEPAAGEPAADPEPESEPAAETPAAEDAGADEETATADADAADLSEADVEAIAVEQMRELDEGDGAAHDEVVAAVVDETGVDPGTVEDAIQSALMSGQCYEPGDGQLKAI